MNKKEQKQKLWERIKPEILQEIGTNHKLSVEGLEKDSEYFHPVVTISESEFLRAQCDTENDCYYAVYLHSTKKLSAFEHITIDLKTSSFKEAIKIVKNQKLPTSIKETFDEIEVLKNSIDAINELIEAKRKLLNSIVARN